MTGFCASLNKGVAIPWVFSRAQALEALAHFHACRHLSQSHRPRQCQMLPSKRFQLHSKTSTSSPVLFRSKTSPLYPLQLPLLNRPQQRCQTFIMLQYMAHMVMSSEPDSRRRKRRTTGSMRCGRRSTEPSRRRQAMLDGREKHLGSLRDG